MEPITAIPTVDTINITWNRPNLNGSGPIRYSVGFSDQTFDVEDTSAVISYVVRDLEPFTIYPLMITAVNDMETEECQTMAKTTEGGKKKNCCICISIRLCRVTFCPLYPFSKSCLRYTYITA